MDTTTPPNPSDSSDLAAKIDAAHLALEEDRQRTAAARLEAPDPSIAAAARLLGMKPREILSVVATEDGLVVNTIGGSPPLIVVPPVRPDCNGRHGLMWLHAPDGHSDVPIFNEVVTVVDDIEVSSAVASDAASKVPVPSSPELEYLERALAGYERDEQLRGSDLPSAVRRLITAERARLFAATPAPPPSEEDVAHWVAVAGWARDRLAVKDLADAVAANSKYSDRLPEFRSNWWKYSEAVLANELAAALRWLEHHGFDADGEAMVTEEPPKRRRRRLS